jgi:hypothetical protein
MCESVCTELFFKKKWGKKDWDPDEDVDTKMHRLPPLTGKYLFFFCSVIYIHACVYMCVYTLTHTHTGW